MSQDANTSTEIKRTVLVTGGAGFIGSNLTDALVARGYKVLVLDDLSTGNRLRVPKEAEFIHGDIRDTSLPALFREKGVSAVFHLAAQVDVRKSVASPAADASINVLGTINIGQAAAQSGVEHVFFASTGGAIYGDPEGHWADETHPLNPCSPYGIAKLAGEKYLQYLSAEAGFKLTILRYANVYGPRQDGTGEAGVVGIFLNRLLAGQDAIIYGDGGQTRDFVFVSDVVGANILALESGTAGVFNVGTGEETSINRLYEYIAQAAGVARPALHEAGKPGEQKRSLLNPGRMKAALQIDSFVSLPEGLRLTADWFRSGQV